MKFQTLLNGGSSLQSKVFELLIMGSPDFSTEPENHIVRVPATDEWC